MDARLDICLMIDFYAQLLTSRQHEILDMYYNGDYSLAEISEELGISRQAVSDNKNKAVESLRKYETMMGLVKKRMELRDILSEADALLEMMAGKLTEAERSELTGRVREMLDGMVKEI